MSKKIQFRKGVEVKNKSKIEVIRGWSNCYRIQTEELTEDGKPKYKYYDKYFINEFKILEEGTDEPVKAKQETKQEDFSFEMDNDELPF